MDRPQSLRARLHVPSQLDRKCWRICASAVCWNLVSWPLAWIVGTAPGTPAYVAVALLTLPIAGIGIAGWALGLLFERNRLPFNEQHFEPLPLEPGYALRGRFLTGLRFNPQRRFEVGLFCERKATGLQSGWRTVWREERTAGSWPVHEGTRIQFGVRIPAVARMPTPEGAAGERWRLVLRARNLERDGDACEREFLLPGAVVHNVPVQGGSMLAAER